MSERYKECGNVLTASASDPGVFFTRGSRAFGAQVDEFPIITLWFQMLYPCWKVVSAQTKDGRGRDIDFSHSPFAVLCRRTMMG